MQPAHLHRCATPLIDRLNHGSLTAASPEPTARSRAAQRGVFLPVGLLTRWLDRTLQGRVTPEHLQVYLDEFVFRFNRRHASQRGLLFYWLLEQAVRTDPLTYHELVAVPAPKKSRPRHPARNDSQALWSSNR